MFMAHPYSPIFIPHFSFSSLFFFTLLNIIFAYLLLGLAQHVHGAHVDLLAQSILGVLQLLNAAPGLARVVRLKVVGRVGLPKVLLLGGDPLVVLDVILNLKGVDEKKRYRH